MVHVQYMYVRLHVCKVACMVQRSPVELLGQSGGGVNHRFLGHLHRSLETHRLFLQLLYHNPVCGARIRVWTCDAWEGVRVYVYAYTGTCIYNHTCVCVCVYIAPYSADANLIECTAQIKRMRGRSIMHTFTNTHPHPRKVIMWIQKLLSGTCHLSVIFAPKPPPPSACAAGSSCARKTVCVCTGVSVRMYVYVCNF